MKAKPNHTRSEPVSAHARTLLEQNQFREAITAYKNLLKSNRDPQLEQELAEAYRGRARELAAKTMHPEAVVLWENQAKLTQQSPCAPEYVIWLMKSGSYAKLAGMIDTAAQVMEPSGHARPLLETLALLALDDSKLLAQFPPDHAIVRHHPLMVGALRAYSSGNHEETEARLQQISSRSPYREMRTLLKSFLLLESDRSAGVDLLGKIGQDSVLWQLAQTLRTHVSADGVVAGDYLGQGNRIQTLINKLNGYEKRQLNVLRDLKKLEQSGSDRVAFEFVLSNKDAFGEESVQRYCYAMLVNYPAGLKLYERHFGKIPKLEAIRIAALNNESNHFDDDAMDNWEQYLGQYRIEEADDEKFKAMNTTLLRHCYRMLNGSSEGGNGLGLLARSVELDPYDKPSYLALYRGYLNHDPKKALYYLEQALSFYPEDVDILTLAMHSAAQRKSFKKAAAYAKTILAVDPINTMAREFLIDAHLGHARKQIKANRLDLAQKELDMARTLDSYERNINLYYLQGILLLKKGDEKEGVEAITTGLRRQGGGLLGLVVYNMERAVVGLLGSRTPPLSQSFVDKKWVPGKADFVGLLRYLEDLHPDQHKNMNMVLSMLRSGIRKGISTADLTTSNLFDLGLGFTGIGAFDYVAYCAEKLRSMDADSAAAEYFDLLVFCRGEPVHMNSWHVKQLETIRAKARSSGDARTLEQIGRLAAKLSARFQRDTQDTDFSFDEGSTEQIFIERLNELGRMSKKELFEYLAKTRGKNALKNLDHTELLRLAVLGLMDELHLDPEEVEQIIRN